MWGHKPNLELSVSQAYSPSLGVGGRVGKTATPRLPNSALLRMSLGGLGRTTSGQLSKEKAPATFCWASWLGAGPQGTVTSDPAAPGLRLPGDQSSLHPPCTLPAPSLPRTRTLPETAPLRPVSHSRSALTVPLFWGTLSVLSFPELRRPRCGHWTAPVPSGLCPCPSLPPPHHTLAASVLTRVKLLRDAECRVKTPVQLPSLQVSVFFFRSEAVGIPTTHISFISC